MTTQQRLSAFLVSFSVAAIAVGGDLSPPPGAIAPTMKAIDAIEPRVCINELPPAPDAVHFITAPGVYYLVADIIGAPGQHGILVDADDVSIDLNGFIIQGVPGSLDGVHVNAGANRRFGIGIGTPSSPLGASRSAIRDFDGDGVHAAGVSGFSMTGVALENNTGDGADVTVACNEEMDTPVVFNKITSQLNGGNGIIVQNTIVGGGARGGVYCSVKLDCIDMTVCMNGLDGIHIENLPSVQIQGVQCLGNGGDGVSATVTARTAGEGFFDIAFSRANNNGGHGVSVIGVPNAAGSPSSDKCYAADTTACGNGLDGFHAEDLVGASFVRCSSAKNSGAGYFKVYQPGQPIFGNILFDGSSATENGLEGAALSLPANSSFLVKAHDSSFNANGVLLIAAGLDIGSSGGVPDPAASSVLDVQLDGVTTSQNSGEGLLFKARHDAMMATIQNCRAIANERSGVDIGSDEGAGVQFDVAARFDDLFCSANGEDGARIAGTASVENSDFSNNTGSGLAISGFPGTGAAHCRNVSTDRNGADGLSISGALGGDVSACRANGNTGAGISVGGGGVPGADPSSGLKIDECFASFNGIGIAVSGENFVLRCGGSHNILANLSFDLDVFAGPSVVSPVWTECKPYAWT